MRYFSKENELKFFKIPSRFDKYTPKHILQYAIGANMYVPGIHKSLYEKLVTGKFYNVGALTLCLEDSIEDSVVQDAEKNILSLLDRLYGYTQENAEHNLPLIFIRVRNMKQFESFAGMFTKEHLAILCGFSFPKFNSENGCGYFSVLDDLSRKHDEVLFGMPIIEDKRVIYKEYRMNELSKIQNILNKYENRVLNMRVGGTDFSSLFGLRRDVSTTIYDIKVVSDCLTDIINFFMREECRYVISGPVWEYYAWDENSAEMVGLKKELSLDMQNGFIGKTIIHPAQIEVVNKAYVVNFNEYQDALGIINSNGGVFSSCKGNRMNETEPHRSWAGIIMARAEIFGVTTANTVI